MRGNRSCGSCTVCCVEPAVVELNKPCGVACQNLAPGGGPNACMIYEQRPKSCATFRCAWLCDEGMPDKFRPDRCGIMLVGRPGKLLQVWDFGAEWEGSQLHEFISRFDHGYRVEVQGRPKEVEIIDQQSTRHPMVSGSGEIGLKYTVTLPKGNSDG